MQLHLDSSFGGFRLSDLFGIPVFRGITSSGFSPSTVWLDGDFLSVSLLLCLAFRDFRVRLDDILPRESFLAELFSTVVIVGRENSEKSWFSFSMAIVAAW